MMKTSSVATFSIIAFMKCSILVSQHQIAAAHELRRELVVPPPEGPGNSTDATLPAPPLAVTTDSDPLCSGENCTSTISEDPDDPDDLVLCDDSIFSGIDEVIEQEGIHTNHTKTKTSKAPSKAPKDTNTKIPKASKAPKCAKSTKAPKSGESTDTGMSPMLNTTSSGGYLSMPCTFSTLSLGFLALAWLV